MPHRPPVFLAAVALLLLATPGLAAPSRAEDRPDEVLVRLALEAARSVERSGGTESVPEFLEPFGVTGIRQLSRAWPGRVPPLLRQFGLDRLYALEIAPAQELRALCVRLAADSRIESAEPADAGEGGAEQAIPLDSFFVDQWHLNNIGQLGGTEDADLDGVEAWTKTIGRRETLIAVLDSGIDGDHTEFRGRVVPGGYDFWNDDPDPEDDHSHGSRVSGVVAANANNRFGVAGLDWRAEVMPIKVLNENNRGNTAVLIEGLLHAAAVGANVANLSLIHYPDSLNLRNAVSFAHAAGVILIGCNGNDGTDELNYPASYAEVVSTGWSNGNDQRDAGSNFTPTLDLIAPGRSIRTVSWGNPTDQRDFFSGCSAATPSVVASVSLLLALDPTLSFEQVRKILRDSAEDEVGNLSEDRPGRDDYYGWGRLNTNLALDRLGLSSANRMHVDRIEMRRIDTTRLEIHVTVVDEWAGVEPGAQVTGRLDTPQASDLLLTGTTGSNGEVTLVHDDGTTLTDGSFRFEVTDVSLDGFVYDFAANHVTELTRRPDFDGIHVRSVEFIRNVSGFVVRVQVVDDDDTPEGGVTVEGTLARPAGPTENLQSSTNWAAGGVAFFVVDPGTAPDPGAYGFEVTHLSKSGFEYEDERDATVEAALSIVAPNADPDGDGIPHEQDNCPTTANAAQDDADLDGFGDACDVCPGQVDFAQRDDDDDGAGNRCDCAPYDPGRVGLDPVPGFGIDDDRRSLRWFGVSGADGYDISRGLLATLDGTDYGACIADDEESRGFKDDTVPAPGTGFFYVIRADDAICGAGPSGFGAEGAARVNTNPAGCS